jgi:hypothetical protein
MSSVVDDELLKRQIYLAENYRFGRANLKVSQIFVGHGYCRAEIFGWAGARPSKLLFANRYSPFTVFSDLPIC